MQELIQSLSERVAFVSRFVEPLHAGFQIEFDAFAGEVGACKPTHRVGVAATGGLGKPIAGEGEALAVEQPESEFALSDSVTAIGGKSEADLFGGELGSVEREGVAEFNMRFCITEIARRFEASVLDVTPKCAFGDAGEGAGGVEADGGHGGLQVFALSFELIFGFEHVDLHGDVSTEVDGKQQS